ncbi:uncharacterized protein ACRADG_011521 [Cochliomyia hominivorax]
MNHLCGIRLSTVSMVVGWLNLIGAIFSTIILIVAFARLDEVIKMIQEEMDNKNVDISTTVIIALSVYLTISLANVFASAILIVGTVKERHLLLAPWLINAYIFIFFNVLNFIYMIYVSIAASFPIGSVIFGILTAGLSLAIQCTIWNAIYSHYKQLRANSDLQQRLLPTSSSGPSYTNYTKMPPTSY